MRSTMPAMFCDSEDGCDEWHIDWYEGTASNWRDLLDGWQYDPRTGAAFCPEHTTTATTEGAGR